MKAALKRKWIKALRSGKYKQAREELRTVNNKFCCLGVLADVGGVQWRGNKDNGFYLGANSHGEFSRPFLRRFGLTDETQSTLIKMNDGATGGYGEPRVARRSFSKIAAWISRNL